MTQDASNYYRFCPDRPDVVISDAVCASRRRVHFHLCAGCRFNDDERAWWANQETAPAPEPPGEPTTPIRIQPATRSARDA
ncbi:MAG: hypothetical protein ACE5E6_05990 [Phycisphaerae bacterium]